MLGLSLLNSLQKISMQKIISKLVFNSVRILEEDLESTTLSKLGDYDMYEFDSNTVAC